MAALALPDSPSYSRSVLAGTVDTRHIDELLDDAQLTTIVHLAREAARPMGKGPKRPQRQFCAERRQRVRVRNRSISSRFISGRYWARTSDLLLVRQEPPLREVVLCRASPCKCRQIGVGGMTVDGVPRQSGAPLMHPGTSASPPRLHSPVTIGALADRSRGLSGRPARLALRPSHSIHAGPSAVRVSAGGAERAAPIAVSASMFGISSNSSIT